MQGIMLADGTTIPGTIGLSGDSIMLEIPTDSLTSSIKSKLQNPSNTAKITYYYGLYKNVYRGYTQYSYNAEDDNPYDGVSYIWMKNAQQATAATARSEAIARGESVDTKIPSNNSMRVYLGPVSAQGAQDDSGHLKPSDRVIYDRTIDE